mgnify:CR=1 FL=1|jgi:uncharacterized integral membrane protein
MQLIVILGIIVAIGGVSFALQNTIPVTVTFLVWRFDSSLAMVLLVSLALGALIVALVSTPATVKAQWAASRLRKQLDAAQSANQTLEKKISLLEGRLSALPQPVAQPQMSAPIMPVFPMTDPVHDKDRL